MHDAAPISQSPYRTSDVLELTLELDTKSREIERLRAWKKRSRIGVVIALTIALVHVAGFSGVLMLRYVPKQEAAPPPEPVAAPACPPAAPDTRTIDALQAAMLASVPESEPEPSALEQVGGDEKVPALATEVTRALFADPVIARNYRLQAYGRDRAEIVVRQQLQVLLSATQDADTVDASEVAWEIRPSHAEWAAMRNVIDTVLEKHDVSDSARLQIRDQIDGNENQATDEVTVRRTSLHARASVGLGCAESQLTSRPIENADTRIVTGCGKSAIYNYSMDPNTSVFMWKREPNP